MSKDDGRHVTPPCSPVPSDIVDVIDHLHRETTEGPWTNRFYTGGGSTIAVPSGFLLPVDKDGHCLSSADICFIVEVHSRWPQIKAALSAQSESERIPVALLREHWLHAIECNHETKQDMPICACSKVNLGWHPSVGAAVEAWLTHLTEAAKEA